jgi:spermidine/putrescine transport system substrate-binding protein
MNEDTAAGAGIHPARVSRRSFIGRSAGSLLAVGGTSAFLSACGGKSGKQVVVLSWESYVTNAIVNRFEKTTGIQMIGVPAPDDQTMFTKVLAGGGGQYDLVFGNAGWSPTYHKHGLVEVLDLTQIAAAKNLFPVFRTEPTFPYVVAPNKTLLYPNTWSPLGMMWNVSVPYQPSQPYSWNDMWSKAIPKDKVMLYGAGIEFLSIAGLAIGVPRSQVYSMRGATLQAATKKLIELKPFQIDPNIDQQFRTAIRTGNAWIGYASSIGEAAITNLEAKKVVAKSTIPKEGTVGWVDGAHLVKGAKNRANALKFIEWWGSDPWVGEYLFSNYNYAECSATNVHRIVAAGGAPAKMMVSVSGLNPAAARQMAFQRQPDFPNEYAAAWDQVTAA